jgi:hypothetical protein
VFVFSRSKREEAELDEIHLLKGFWLRTFHSEWGCVGAGACLSQGKARAVAKKFPSASSISTQYKYTAFSAALVSSQLSVAFVFL